MWIFSIVSLASLAALAASITAALVISRGRARKPAGGGSRRFEEIEEKIRSLRSAGKIAGPDAALEQVALELGGEDVPGKLRGFRESRDRLARSRPPAPSGGDFEGSLVIPRVFRESDPDVGLARLFYEMGARGRGADVRMPVLAGASIGAWALFAAALVLRIAGI